MWKCGFRLFNKWCNAQITSMRRMVFQSTESGHEAPHKVNRGLRGGTYKGQHTPLWTEKIPDAKEGNSMNNSMLTIDDLARIGQWYR